jgi:DNA primase
MTTTVGAWLASAFSLCSISEEGRDYVMGRGATDQIIDEWGIRTFETPPDPCPDPRLHHHFGEHFDRFEGKLIYPLYSPRGKLMGFDSRTPYRKDDDLYLLPAARWNVVWSGMPSAMSGIWAGRDVVVVEGRYDVWAMLHAVTREQAILGSNSAHLTWKHVEFLRRWVLGDVYMAYDNDAAGRKGTDDALKYLNGARVACSRIRYGRAGEDPGAIWDKGGVEALRETFPHL